MSPPILLIFIDSFPFYYLDKTKYLSKFETVAKLTPGFGYSINCQAEIFAGLSPDNLGYFCEWTYDPLNSPFKKWKYLLNILSPARKIYYLDRFLHKIIDNIYTNAKNIPFAYLHKMARNKQDIFSNYFSYDSLLKHKDTIVLPTQDFLSLPPAKRDLKIYEKSISLIDTINNKNLIISQTELDGIAHWHGVGSYKYNENISLLDQRIVNLRERFLNRFKDGKVIIVSDHGMTNVKKSIKIELEKNIGRPNDRTYYYFLDGTILRIWIFKTAVKEKIETYLESMGIGSIIDTNQRKRFGISNRKFGDVIFLINEGLMFIPCFWGSRISKAMHGYHPDLESQKGIILCSQKEQDLSYKSISSKDVYYFLKSKFIN